MAFVSYREPEVQHVFYFLFKTGVEGEGQVLGPTLCPCRTVVGAVMDDPKFDRYLLILATQIPQLFG